MGLGILVSELSSHSFWLQLLLSRPWSTPNPHLMSPAGTHQDSLLTLSFSVSDAASVVLLADDAARNVLTGSSARLVGDSAILLTSQ